MNLKRLEATRWWLALGGVRPDAIHYGLPVRHMPRNSWVFDYVKSIPVDARLVASTRPLGVKMGGRDWGGKAPLPPRSRAPNGQAVHGFGSSVKVPAELTALGTVWDAGGLHLQIAPRRVAPGDQAAPSDTKSWLFHYTLRGKARELGLGPVGKPLGGVPPAEARELAAAARALLREGCDPIAER
jgi:hypothetical protein